MKLSERLRAAKALIDTPEKWTKGTLYYDLYGVSQDQPTPGGCMCMMGALVAEEHSRTGVECMLTHAATGPWGEADNAAATVVAISTAIFARVQREEQKFIPAFNDDRKTTHADVMAVFDAAIANAEELECGL